MVWINYAVTIAGFREFSLSIMGNDKCPFSGTCSLSRFFRYSASKLFCRLMAGAAILPSDGIQSTGVDLTVPAIVLIALFNPHPLSLHELYLAMMNCSVQRKS